MPQQDNAKQLEIYLRSLPIAKEHKNALWDAYYADDDKAEAAFKAVPVDKSYKFALWDHRFEGKGLTPLAQQTLTAPVAPQGTFSASGTPVSKPVAAPSAPVSSLERDPISHVLAPMARQLQKPLMERLGLPSVAESFATAIRPAARRMPSGEIVRPPGGIPGMMQTGAKLAGGFIDFFTTIPGAAAMVTGPGAPLFTSAAFTTDMALASKASYERLQERLPAATMNEIKARLSKGDVRGAADLVPADELEDFLVPLGMTALLAGHTARGSGSTAVRPTYPEPSASEVVPRPQVTPPPTEAAPVVEAPPFTPPAPVVKPTIPVDLAKHSPRLGRITDTIDELQDAQRGI